MSLSLRDGVDFALAKFKPAAFRGDQRLASVSRTEYAGVLISPGRTMISDGIDGILGNAAVVTLPLDICSNIPRCYPDPE